MKKINPIMLAAGIAILAIALPTHATDRQGTLKQCQTIKDNIERYTNLRRQGGRSAQMSAWQKQRNGYKKRYAEYRCSVHRKTLN